MKATIDDIGKWDWIECPKCGFGQRFDPELKKKGAIPFCPDCNCDMVINNEMHN